MLLKRLREQLYESHLQVSLDVYKNYRKKGLLFQEVLSILQKFLIHYIPIPDFLHHSSLHVSFQVNTGRGFYPLYPLRGFETTFIPLFQYLQVSVFRGQGLRPVVTTNYSSEGFILLSSHTPVTRTLIVRVSFKGQGFVLRLRRTLDPWTFLAHKSLLPIETPSDVPVYYPTVVKEFGSWTFILEPQDVVESL